jgi:hypothetical protein
VNPTNNPPRDSTGQWMTEGERITALETIVADLRAAVVQLTARLRKAEIALGIPVVYIPKTDNENRS